MIIDHREKKIIEILENKKIDFEVKTLPMGDIIIEDTIIERKTYRDLEDSIISGRIFEQMKRINENFKNKILIIEGKFSFERLSQNHIFGFISSAIVNFNFSVLNLRDEYETVNFIINLEKRYSKNKKTSIKLVNVKKNDPNKIKLAMLSCLPNISYQKAKKILDKFKTIKNFVNNVDKICQIDGIGTKTKEKIKEIIEN